MKKIKKTAVETLKNDHRKIEKLFREYDAGGDDMRDLSNEIFENLETHTLAEEEIFYPAVESIEEGEIVGLISESEREHKIIKELIEELREIDPDNEDFAIKMEELKTNVQKHIQKEESEIFPFAEDKLNDDENTLSEAIRRLKSEIE